MVLAFGGNGLERVDQLSDANAGADSGRPYYLIYS